MATEKIKFALRNTPEMQKLVKDLCPRDNCQSQNEFIDKAIRFYAGYLSAKDAVEVLPPALVAALKGTVQDSEGRIARLLFKLAVELDMLMNILAAELDVSESTLQGARSPGAVRPGGTADRRQHHFPGRGALPEGRVTHGASTHCKDTIHQGPSPKDLSAPEKLCPVHGHTGGAEKPPPPNFQQKENYTRYIASRPRAERVSDHALFSGADEPVVLSQAVKEVANHPGNVWKPIISLRREDAERLGYNNAQAWKNLLSGYAVEMSQAMKIPLEQFRRYAAFHNEGHHPHVHMVCYSADGKSGFLTKDGLAKIKSGLAKEIFRQELTGIYSRQTQRRDSLTAETKNVLEQLIQRIQGGAPESERAGQLLLRLGEKLKTVGGKK